MRRGHSLSLLTSAIYSSQVSGSVSFFPATMGDPPPKKRLELTRLTPEEVQVEVDANGNFVQKLERGASALDAWDVTLGERVDEMDENSKERKLTEFYKAVLRDVKEYGVLVRFYQRHKETTLQGYSFGHMVVGLAIYENQAREQILVDVMASHALLDEFIEIIDEMRVKVQRTDEWKDNQIDKLEDLSERIHLIVNTEGDGSKNRIKEDVKKIKLLHEDGEELRVDALLDEMKKWAELKKAFSENEGTPGIFAYKWERGFLASHPLSKFLTTVAVLEQEANFNAISGRCYSYLVAMYSNPANFTYDRHFTKSESGDDIEWRRTEAANLQFFFDFGQVGLLPLYRVTLGHASLGDEKNYRHLVKIVGRLEGRYDMVEKLKTTLLRDIEVVLPPNMEKNELVDAFTLDACTVFDYYLEKNLLDLPLFGLPARDIDRIVLRVLANVAQTFSLALKDNGGMNDEGSFDDSHSEMEVDDDSDPEVESEFEEDSGEDDSVVDHSEEDEALPSYYEEVRERKKRLKKIAIERRAERKKKKEQGKEEKEEEDEMEVEGNKKQDYSVTIADAEYRDKPWNVFFQFLERGGVSFADFFYDHRKERELPPALVPGYSPVSCFFVSEHAELIAGTTQDPLNRIAAVIKDGRFNDDIEHEKTQCSAWIGMSPNISPVSAKLIGEIWALVRALEYGKAVKWTPDEARKDPGFHIYRVLQLEFAQGLFAYKYRNGLQVDQDSEWEDLLEVLSEEGYPILEQGVGDWSKEAQKAHKRAYMAETEHLDAVRRAILHRPGLTFAEQLWYLLPQRMKDWFKLAARYLEEVLDGHNPGRAWWYSNDQASRGPTPWLRSNEVYELFEDIIMDFEPDDDEYSWNNLSNKMFESFFSSNTMVMLETLQYIKNCPKEWKREFAKLSQKYCHYDDDSMTRKFDFVVENLVKPVGTPEFWEEFVPFVRYRLDEIDCPVKAQDGEIHLDTEVSRGHNNAVEISSVPNFLLVVCHALAYAKLTNKILEGESVWRSVHVEKEEEDEEDENQGMKRLRESDDVKEKEAKKARYKARASLFHRFR